MWFKIIFIFGQFSLYGLIKLWFFLFFRLTKTVFFDRYVRISPESFQYLLCVVGPNIAKRDTILRKAILTHERLCLTLHFLVYGGSRQSLCFSYCIGAPTTWGIFQDVCLAIWDSLNETYLRPPRTTDGL